jgi:hypothetical protein
MGFSVHQPAIGAPLQFFPAMGSKQLDDMINAYIPGDASILDKRAAVSMEFFQYTIATGDLFKFFMVYSNVPSNGASPAVDSGYCSGFTTSPAMSDSPWANTSSPQMASPSSSKKIASTTDFSNLPGMKIMTKDGQDVTNSASRGCKTKEQRDHAHLMRIIKACDACRRKKTKCDPSHKRSAAGTASGKVTKKTSKNSRPTAAPPQIAAKQASSTSGFDQFLTESSSSFDSLFSQSLDAPIDGLFMECDQFIQYDQQPTDMIPYDFDFILDPAHYFSPTTTAPAFSSSSTSPSQLPTTPIDRDQNITDTAPDGHTHKPILPYLSPGVLEVGSNYVDFNLYSPASSFSDEELGFAKELAAKPILSQKEQHHGIYQDHHNDILPDHHQQFTNSAAVFDMDAEAVNNETVFSSPLHVIHDVGNGLFHDTSNYRHRSPIDIMAARLAAVLDLDSAQAHLEPSHTVQSAIATTPFVVDNVVEGVTSEGLYGRDAILDRRLSTAHGKSRSPSAPTSTSAATDGIRERPGVSETSSHNTHVVNTDGQCQYALTSSRTESLSVEDVRLGAFMVRSSPLSEPGLGLNVSQDQGRDNSYIASTQLSVLIVRNTTLSEPGLELNVTQDHAHKIRSTAPAQFATYRVPSLRNPSPSLGPVTTPSTPNEVPLISDIMSAVTANTKQQMNGPPILSMVTHPSCEQDSSSTVSRDAQNALCNTAAMRPGFLAGASQLLAFAMQLTELAITDLGALSAAASFSPNRLTMSKGNGLVTDLRPTVSGRSAKYASALLLLCIASLAPSVLISFISISALSIISQIHARQQTLIPFADTHPSNSRAPHVLPFMKQLYSDITNNARASYVQIRHVMECDFGGKLKSWTDNSLLPPGKRSSRPDHARWLTSRTKIPLV